MSKRTVYAMLLTLHQLGKVKAADVALRAEFTLDEILSDISKIGS